MPRTPASGGGTRTNHCLAFRLRLASHERTELLASPSIVDIANAFIPFAVLCGLSIPPTCKWLQPKGFPSPLKPAQ